MCAAGNSNRELVDIARIPTTTPQETLSQVGEYFNGECSRYPLESFGICSFGPLDLRPASPSFRQITSTPKAGWNGINIPQVLEERFQIPAVIDTDVNGSVLSEWLWGAGQGYGSVLYLTIGTGIGGGAIANGNIIHGRFHPEMGHISIRRSRHDRFAGICPYHRDCFEGLASGPAMTGRWKQPADELPGSHPAWELEAAYIAQALVAYTYILSPERILLGGGVMQHTSLFPLIRREVGTLLSGYLTPQDLDAYITTPGLDQSSGLAGALALALHTPSSGGTPYASGYVLR